jgi:hypothetical protein
MKSQISMNKGTKSIQLEVGLPNWEGEHFKTYQEKRMALLPKSTIISMNKGTSRVHSSVYPKSRRTSIPVGTRISSGRGTTTRSL